MKIDEYKMPNDIVGTFGNSSGASIPINICKNFKKTSKKKENLVCLAGFGVGLTWASMVINLSSLKFKKLLNYDEIRKIFS